MRRLVLAAAAAALCLAPGCASQEPDTTRDPSGVDTRSPTPGAALPLAAEDNKFDRNTLTAEAKKSFTIEFDNRDQGVQHNVSVYKDSAATQNLFRGELFAGPGKRTYSVPSLATGSYFFRCDVHPQEMTGTLTVS